MRVKATAYRSMAKIFGIRMFTRVKRFFKRRKEDGTRRGCVPLGMAGNLIIVTLIYLLMILIANISFVQTSTREFH